MEKNKFKVSSWNEWDPLKHVIVGKADNCHIPPPEPALDAKVPENSDMKGKWGKSCLLYTSPSPRDRQKARMPSSA